MEEGGSSSAQSSSEEPISSAPTILLHIISPSPEVRTKLTFPHLPISTTVAELKRKICDAVATRPSPDRQRLIYRGRALVQEQATLKEIFSQETINQSEAHSLHLVLPPAGPTQLSRSSQTSATPSSAANENLPRSVVGPADLRPNYQGTTHVASAQATTSGNLPHPQPNAPHIHPQHGPFPPLPAQLPLHLQQVMRSHVEALNQQFGAQNPNNGNAIPQGAPQNQLSNHPATQPAVMLPNFHQIIAQQQQVRAAAGLRGLGSDDRNQTTQTSSASAMPNQAPSTTTGNFPVAGLPVNSRIVQENHGPNGEHWRMVIESTQTVTHPHHHHNLHNNHIQRPTGSSNPNNRTSTPVVSRTSTPQAMGPSGAPSTGHGNPSPGVVQSQQSVLEQSLSSIEAALAVGTAPSEPVVESARMLLDRLSNEPDISANTVNTFRSRLDSLSTRADHLRASLNSILMRVISEQSPSQRPPTPFSTVYLLSSPNGPYALLVSPSGMYTTPWQFPGVAGAYPNNMHLQPSHVPSSTQPINRSTEPDIQNTPPNPVQAAQEPQEQQQQQQQQQEEQQANQVRDLIRILLPLGGHIWLLVRLFGFVYFFTGGGGHRRAILLGLCAFLVFIAQTGVFRPFLQSAWEPFRRHIENLLPLANNDRQLLADAVIAEDDPNPPQGTRHQNIVLTPQQAAERLLREREQRDGNIMRQYLRRAERAIALFIASLVPGVGERHIAARDAAEAARREEESRREREREEREERERGEREREEGRERNERINQEEGENPEGENQEHSETRESVNQEDRNRNEGQNEDTR